MRSSRILDALCALLAMTALDRPEIIPLWNKAAAQFSIAGCRTRAPCSIPHAIRPLSANRAFEGCRCNPGISAYCWPAHGKGQISSFRDKIRRAIHKRRNVCIGSLAKSKHLQYVRRTRWKKRRARRGGREARRAPGGREQNRFEANKTPGPAKPLEANKTAGGKYEESCVLCVFRPDSLRGPGRGGNDAAAQRSGPDVAQ